MSLHPDIKALILLVAENESKGKFSAWNGNDNGHGISFGILQFNQKVGSLYNLLMQCKKANEAKFSEIFGQWTTHLVNRAEFIAADLNTNYFKICFEKVASVPEFQEEQYALAYSEYFLPACKDAFEFGFGSNRAIVALMDSCVQNGPGGTHAFLVKASNNGQVGGWKLLKEFARLADDNKYSGMRRTTWVNAVNSLLDKSFNFDLIKVQEASAPVLKPEEQKAMQYLGITDVAVFQKLHDLQPDGIVGLRTKEQLFTHVLPEVHKNDLTGSLKSIITTLEADLRASTNPTVHLVALTYRAAFRRVLEALTEET